MHKYLPGIIFLCFATNVSAQVLTPLSPPEGHRITRLMDAESDVSRSEGAQSFGVQSEKNGSHYYLGSSITEKKLPNSAHWRFFCTFEIFNNTWKSISRVNAHIKDYEQTNVCQMITGMKGVRWLYDRDTGHDVNPYTTSVTAYKHLGSKSGFIAILQYHGGTAVPTATTIDQIGDNYRWTAVFFEFKEDPNTQLSIVQDDTCFDPMNQIDTLAKAKKVFDTCYPTLK